jgi:hypothetical protein
MSLLDVLRSGVLIADSVTKPLQPEVGFRHFVSVDGEGAKTFNPPLTAPPATIQAIVDWKQKHLRTSEGELTVSRASVMFLNVEEVKRVTNNQGVSDEDIIILPDGTTGPIIDMGGFIDAGTGQPFATEVFLG